MPAPFQLRRAAASECASSALRLATAAVILVSLVSQHAPDRRAEIDFIIDNQQRALVGLRHLYLHAQRPAFPEHRRARIGVQQIGTTQDAHSCITIAMNDK
jgi:hypothetical protein